MPRDATETRARLIRAGERIFAEHGVEGPLQQIVRRAGQRNDSALHYHFGSRRGLLLAIVEKHRTDIESRRRILLAELQDVGQIGNRSRLVAAIVEPMAEKLATEDGRDYLRITAQLITRMRLDDEDEPGSHTAPGHSRAATRAEGRLTGALAMLRRTLELPPPVATLRLQTALSLIVVALGDRARRMDEGDELFVDGETFLHDLIASVTALVEAPVSARVSVP